MYTPPTIATILTNPAMGCWVRSASQTLGFATFGTEIPNPIQNRIPRTINAPQTIRNCCPPLRWFHGFRGGRDGPEGLATAGIVTRKVCHGCMRLTRLQLSRPSTWPTLTIRCVEVVTSAPDRKPCDFQRGPAIGRPVTGGSPAPPEQTVIVASGFSAWRGVAGWPLRRRRRAAAVASSGGEVAPGAMPPAPPARSRAARGASVRGGLDHGGLERPYVACSPCRQYGARLHS